MPMHPAELKALVDRGESVIHKGRVINKELQSQLPSAAELAGSDIQRRQFQLDLDRQIAELQKQRDELKAAPSAEAKPEPEPEPEPEQAPEPEKAPAKVPKTGVVESGKK